MLLAFGVGWYLFPESVLTCAAMAGPVVGAIIGFLIGLRPWVNLAVVLVATYIAIGVWGLLLNELSEWAAHVNRFAPYALVVAIVLIAATMRLPGRRRERAANGESG